MSTVRARFHMHAEVAVQKDGKIQGGRVNVLADHGAFKGTRSRRSPGPGSSTSLRVVRPDLGAMHRSRAVYTNQGPGRRFVSLTRARSGGDRGAYVIERMIDILEYE